MTQPRTRDPEIRRALVTDLLALGVPREAIRHERTLDMNSVGGRADIVLALDY